MTLSQMLAEFRLRIPECTSTRVSDTILTRWLNEAQSIVCRKTGCLKTYSEASTVANQSEYDAPDDLLMIDPDGGVQYYDASNTDYYKLQSVTMDWLDQHVGDWRNADAGLPQVYYRRGSVIGLYPKPDTASDTVRIYYWEDADDMSGDTDEPFSDNESLRPYHDLLLLYALYKGQETSDELDKAKYYRELFELKVNQMLGEVVTDYDNQEPITPYYK
jgi:hypothetical protein